MVATSKSEISKHVGTAGQNPLVKVRSLSGKNMDDAVAEIIENSPKLTEKLLRSENLFIKVNAVYFHPHLYTSPALISAVIKYVRNLDSKKNIYIMDNCSQGNFTRLCFNATGLDKLARRLKVNTLFLDEQEALTINLRKGVSESYTFPAILKRYLIDERDHNFYLNLPVLKSHCQAQMTCGLKNQMGLLYATDRALRHNHSLHQSIVDIYSYIKPDLTLVDSVKVLESGPMPAGRYVNELLHERNLLFGGTDTVAVDTVAALVLGYEPTEVKHLTLAKEQGLGEGDIDKITIDGDLPGDMSRVPWLFKTHFPTSLQFIKGVDGVCYEGCLGHAEQVLELIVNDGSSPEKLEGRPLTIITGRNFTDEQLTGLKGPIVVLGKCACKSALPRLKNMYKDLENLDTCGRCDNILNVAIKKLKVSPAKIAPVSMPKLIYLWLIGKAHGLKYNLPL